jgi:general secretion pathway protein D
MENLPLRLLAYFVNNRPINNNRRACSCFIAVIMLCLPFLLYSQLLLAEDDKQQQTWKVNFKDSDVQEVIKFVAEVTGKTVIVDPRVKGRVQVISEKPLTSDALYNLFLSVLEIQGFTAIEVGDTVRILPRQDARTSAVPVQPQNSLGDDAYVTEVIQLSNADADKVLPVLRPLAPQYSHLAAYAPSNSIIISDTTANIARLKEIIQHIDRAAIAQTDVVTLRYAQASDMVRMLEQLQKTDATNTAASSKSKITLVDDKRSNSVLLTGDSIQRQHVKALIERLDVPQPQTGNVRVIYLQYGDAEKIADVLRKLIASIAKLSPGEPSGPISSANATVEADPDTNALLITADGSTLESLLEVVKRLDIRRAQLLVEAIIVEIEDVVGRDLGVQWVVQNKDGAFATSISNSSAIGAAAAGLAPVKQTQTTTTNGVTTTTTIEKPAEFTNFASSVSGLVGSTIGVGKLNSDTNFIALINALKQNSGANILSTPNLLTTDNHEASISVGQNVPFVTGSFTTSTGDATNPFQTIERQDVGIALKVTPQINEGNTVVLDIDQEVSSLTGATGAADIITNERKISTQVIVADGEIIVLGGLIRDNVQKSQNKVPLLGDIPFLGRLFRNDSTSITKTNLMVFLRASIIRDDEALTGATAEKYRYIRELQYRERERGAVMVDNAQIPLLPVWDDAIKGAELISIPAQTETVEGPSQ